MSGRIDILDAIRGVAVLGILLRNIVDMASCRIREQGVVFCRTRGDI